MQSLLEVLLSVFSRFAVPVTRWEADVLLPTLCEKAGNKRDDTRTRYGNAVADVCSLLASNTAAAFGALPTAAGVPPIASVLETYVLPVVVGSKNASSRVVLLGVMRRVVEARKSAKAVKRSTLTAVAKLLTDAKWAAASEVREAVLGLFAAVWTALDSDISALRRLLGVDGTGAGRAGAGVVGGAGDSGVEARAWDIIKSRIEQLATAAGISIGAPAAAAGGGAVTRIPSSKTTAAGAAATAAGSRIPGATGAASRIPSSGAAGGVASRLAATARGVAAKPAAVAPPAVPAAAAAATDYDDTAPADAVAADAVRRTGAISRDSIEGCFASERPTLASIDGTVAAALGSTTSSVAAADLEAIDPFSPDYVAPPEGAFEAAIQASGGEGSKRSSLAGDENVDSGAGAAAGADGGGSASGSLRDTTARSTANVAAARAGSAAAAAAAAARVASSKIAFVVKDAAVGSGTGAATAAVASSSAAAASTGSFKPAGASAESILLHGSREVEKSLTADCPVFIKRWLRLMLGTGKEMKKHLLAAGAAASTATSAGGGDAARVAQQSKVDVLQRLGRIAGYTDTIRALTAVQAAVQLESAASADASAAAAVDADGWTGTRAELLGHVARNADVVFASLRAAIHGAYGGLRSSGIRNRSNAIRVDDDMARALFTTMQALLHHLPKPLPVSLDEAEAGIAELMLRGVDCRADKTVPNLCSAVMVRLVKQLDRSTAVVAMLHLAKLPAAWSPPPQDTDADDTAAAALALPAGHECPLHPNVVENVIRMLDKSMLSSAEVAYADAATPAVVRALHELLDGSAACRARAQEMLFVVPAATDASSSRLPAAAAAVELRPLPAFTDAISRAAALRGYAMEMGVNPDFAVPVLSPFITAARYAADLARYRCVEVEALMDAAGVPADAHLGALYAANMRTLAAAQGVRDFADVTPAPRMTREQAGEEAQRLTAKYGTATPGTARKRMARTAAGATPSRAGSVSTMSSLDGEEAAGFRAAAAGIMAGGAASVTGTPSRVRTTSASAVTSAAVAGATGAAVAEPKQPKRTSPFQAMLSRAADDEDAADARVVASSLARPTIGGVSSLRAGARTAAQQLAAATRDLARKRASMEGLEAPTPAELAALTAEEAGTGAPAPPTFVGDWRAEVSELMATMAGLSGEAMIAHFPRLFGVMQAVSAPVTDADAPVVADDFAAFVLDAIRTQFATGIKQQAFSTRLKSFVAGQPKLRVYPFARLILGGSASGASARGIPRPRATVAPPAAPVTAVASAPAAAADATAPAPPAVAVAAAAGDEAAAPLPEFSATVARAPALTARRASNVSLGVGPRGQKPRAAAAAAVAAPEAATGTA